ncbi:hypothetical protein [Rhizobium sp. UGM030330-04]|uniref:hypothetical protein n=1 Tax=Rhizobium sp. UGM030330-04 TaxID=1378077 RepID=UPI001AECFA5A|nr:hypothetical protein [Rhizobium sp. UGM030330-04]
MALPAKAINAEFDHIANFQEDCGFIPSPTPGGVRVAVVTRRNAHSRGSATGQAAKER